jgi:hypothetical protein
VFLDTTSALMSLALKLSLTLAGLATAWHQMG